MNLHSAFGWSRAISRIPIQSSRIQVSIQNCDLTQYYLHTYVPLIFFFLYLYATYELPITNRSRYMWNSTNFKFEKTLVILQLLFRLQFTHCKWNKIVTVTRISCRTIHISQMLGIHFSTILSRIIVSVKRMLNYI